MDIGGEHGPRRLVSRRELGKGWPRATPGLRLQADVSGATPEARRTRRWAPIAGQSGRIAVFG